VTKPKRPKTDVVDEAGQLEANEEPRENGRRGFLHWQDRGEPPASTSRVAMAQACPYPRDDSRAAAFFEGWRLADGSAWDREWCAVARPELRGKRCRVVHRPTPMRLEIEFRDGTRLTVPSLWTRKVDH